LERRHAAEVSAAAATGIEAQNTGPQFAVDLRGVLEHVDAVAAIVGIGIQPAPLAVVSDTERL